MESIGQWTRPQPYPKAGGVKGVAYHSFITYALLD